MGNIQSIAAPVGSRNHHSPVAFVWTAIGDATCVLFTAGYTDNIPTSLDQPTATLPLAIFFQLSSPIPEVQERAYAAALILTIIVLIISLAAKYFSKKFSKNKI